MACQRFSEKWNTAGEKPPLVTVKSLSHFEGIYANKKKCKEWNKIGTWESSFSPIGAACTHLLQYLADILAPEDEEDDDDQEQDDGHEAANQNGRVAVLLRVIGWWTGSCRKETRCEEGGVWSVLEAAAKKFALKTCMLLFLAHIDLWNHQRKQTRCCISLGLFDAVQVRQRSYLWLPWWSHLWL